MSAAAYEPAIGLEVHVQLATATKLFCGDSAGFGAPPNTRVCPVCLGLPGALPVTNTAAVALAVRAAVALRCTVHGTSRFERKHYFYPDLPKGYQITQHERPLATAGWLDVAADGAPPRPIAIRRVHLEEDAGRSVHDRFPGSTGIDLNRAGIALIEIVTEPVLRTPTEARTFLARLKQILQYVGVSDCDMEKGSLRVDANISVNPAGAPSLGTRTELKNLNSFSNVERALRFETLRQQRILERGGAVLHETLEWDAGAREARARRTKEETRDYRFFPDPDLPPLRVPTRLLEEERQALPELPDARRRRFRLEHGLPDYDAGVLTAARALADYYEAVVAEGEDPKVTSNWVMTEVRAHLSRLAAAVDAFPVPPPRLAALIRLVREGVVSTTVGRHVLDRMVATGLDPAAIIEAEGLGLIADESRVKAWVEDVLREHPEERGRLYAGDRRMIRFFMGRVMERSGGRADPRLAAERLASRLPR
jgi:aspartyl-tRNA(Asn)/glutamyl-tRNA(Gln) amidotransferase subunit B